jgi:hypothetical protein
LIALLITLAGLAGLTLRGGRSLLLRRPNLDQRETDEKCGR